MTCYDCLNCKLGLVPRFYPVKVNAVGMFMVGAICLDFGYMINDVNCAEICCKFSTKWTSDDVK